MEFKFNTKLILSYAGILLSALICMLFTAEYSLHDSTFELGKSVSKKLVESTMYAVEAQLEQQERLARVVVTKIEDEYQEEQDPKKVVASVFSEYGVSAVFLKKQGDDFIRIASSGPASTGRYAVGTKLERDSEEYKALTSGESWKGMRLLEGVPSVLFYHAMNADTIAYASLPIIDEKFDEFLSSVAIGGVGYVFIHSSEGFTYWHPNSDFIGNDITDRTFAKPLLEEKNGLVSYAYRGEKKYAYTIFDEKIDLHVAFGLTESEINFGLGEATQEALILGALAGLLVAVIVCVFAIRYMTKILSLVGNAASDLARGHYDIEVNYWPDDTIRESLEAMQLMGKQIKEHMENVRIKSEDAMLAKADAEAALEDVQKSQQEIKTTNEKIIGAVAEVRAVSENLSASSVELSGQIEQVTRGAEVQKQRVSEVATAVEEMSATVMEVARSAGDTSGQAKDSSQKAIKGMEIMDQTIISIGSIQDIDTASSQAMGELSGRADAVGGIVRVIEDIADQTNLLALNAAIEAARAGDAGRGFAVVADEVRKLAEKTMSATKEVGDSITDIQNAVSKNVEERRRAQDALDETVKSAHQVNTILKEIVASIAQSARMASGIATATEEQSAVTEEIIRSVGDVDNISTDTSTAMRESEQAVRGLVKLVEELEQIIKSLDR